MHKTSAYIRLIATFVGLLLFTGFAVNSDASIIKRISLAPSGPGAPHQQRHQTLAKLTRGKFLVANPGLNDGRFAQTVILIFEYSEHGAGGLIINRPTSFTVKDALPAINTGRLAAEKIYIGGPVESNNLFMLVRAPKQLQGAQHVTKDVYITTRTDVFNQVASNDRLAANSRVYAGYAGWGPLQLDREMLHNDWYLADGDIATIFSAKADDVWPALITALKP